MTMATQNTAKAVTSVFWDIKSCPVPTGYDPRRVGPCIKRFLKNLGYSGPLTITAFAVLTNVPHGVLQAISSTGIVFNHVPDASKSLVSYVVAWTHENPPPANIMVISDLSRIASSFESLLREMGYNIIQLFPPHSVVSTNVQRLWKRFFLADTEALEENKCSKKGESKDSCSSVCGYGFDVHPGQSFKNLTTHLSSQEHARQMLDWITPFNGHLSVDSHRENATSMTYNSPPLKDLHLPYHEATEARTYAPFDFGRENDTTTYLHLPHKKDCEAVEAGADVPLDSHIRRMLLPWVRIKEVSNNTS